MKQSTTLLQNLNVDLKISPTGRHFLLMDCAIDEGLIKHYFDLEEQPEYYPLLHESQELLQVSPYLIALKPSTDAFLEWFIHYADQWGFIFFSNETFDNLYRHWKSLTEIKLPDGDNLMLRFGDGKVLLELWHHMNDDEKNSFFFPCQSIHLQDESRQWHRHALADKPSQQLTEKTQPWFSLSHPTYQALICNQDQAFINELVDTLWQQYPDRLRKIPEDSITHIIQHGMNTARSLEINSEQHLSMFICLMFEFSLSFYQEETTAALFESERNIDPIGYGERALDKLVATYTPDNWQQLAAVPAFGDI